MKDFDAAGAAVYALSYDEPDALSDFRDTHDITYTLLSDPDSEVIRSFGILNTLIDPDDHPWFGIPFPGAYVVEADGRISQKFFEGNIAIRTGPEQLLRALRGEASETTPEAMSGEARETVGVDVTLDGDALARTVQKDLVARFTVPRGRHVYADPAPEGMVGVDLVLDADPRLVHQAVVRPPTDTHALAGTGESFEVHHDVFELRLPLTVNNSDGVVAPEITVAGEVRWQSCDDEMCDIPTRQRFELVLPVSAPPPVALGTDEGAALEPRAVAHFLRMSERRKE